MFDEYVMNKETGELIPATVAIKEFYKDHKYPDTWADLYIPTGIPCNEIELDVPNFSKTVNI